jgi:hypothetical protein
MSMFVVFDINEQDSRRNPMFQPGGKSVYHRRWLRSSSEHEPYVAYGMVSCMVE